MYQEPSYPAVSLKLVLVGVSLTHLVVVQVEFLFHTSSVLVLVRCFSYTPDANFSEVFLLHTSC